MVTYENAEKDMAKMNMNIGEIVNLIQEISMIVNQIVLKSRFKELYLRLLIGWILMSGCIY